MSAYMHKPGEWSWEFNIHAINSDDEKYQAMSFEYKGLAYQFWTNKKGEVEYWEPNKVYCRMIYPMEARECLITQEQIETHEDKAWRAFSKKYVDGLRGYQYAKPGEPDFMIGYNKWRESDRKEKLIYFKDIMKEFEFSKIMSSGDQRKYSNHFGTKRKPSPDLTNLI